MDQGEDDLGLYGWEPGTVMVRCLDCDREATDTMRIGSASSIRCDIHALEAKQRTELRQAQHEADMLVCSMRDRSVTILFLALTAWGVILAGVAVAA